MLKARDEVRRIAAALLGFDELRPGQEDAAAAVLEGRDVLAVMPTGSGKSAIYQIAGACIDGATVVVSPLIALQHDQVASIGDDLGGARLVNSTLGERARRDVLEEVAAGTVEFVFVAPEQLANAETAAALAAAAPSLLVVDEAHCISNWGHDFRPEYRQLAAMVENLGRPQILALTATAAPPVRADIVEQLGMRDPVVVVAGFERPNLTIDVNRVRDRDEADDEVRSIVAATAGTGLVYVGTRQAAEDLAAALHSPDRPALAYHAGLSAAQRTAVHERFTDADPVVVAATTAFGMGIDVPHVRFVVHADAPESLDAYLQEIGRAGRDGEPATATLVHPADGASSRRFFGGISVLAPAEVQHVAEAIHASVEPLPVETLASIGTLSDTRLDQVLGMLHDAGAVEVDGDAVAWSGDEPIETYVDAVVEERDAHREVDRTRRDMVRRYLDSTGCRWRFLLGYFGEPTDADCGRCDRCAAGGTDDDAAAIDLPFALDQRVAHPDFGAGTVVELDARSITILFDEAGYRTLDVDVVVDRELLEPGDI